MRKIYLFLFSIITSLSLMGQEVVKSQLPYAAYKKGMELPTLKSGNLSSKGLPTAFSSASAEQIDVLLLAADSYAPDVVTTLTATGKFNVVDLLNDVTPTVATLKNYDAVLVWADNYLDDSIGDTLAAYIDGGGGVVSAVFNLFTGWGIEGSRFNTDYLLLNLGYYSSSGTATLGTVHDASHPIMEGVISLINSNEYRSNNATMTAGSIVVAEWSDGLPLVVVKENVGPSNARRADINIFPPSSNIRSDFWDASTDGGILLANALLWVSKAGNCPRDMVVDNDPGKCSAVVNFTVNAPEKGSVVQTGGLPSGTEFPVGTITNTFLLIDSLGVETTCSFTVTVNDTEAPVVDCPGDIVVYNDPGELCAVVQLPDLGAVIGGEAEPGITLPNAPINQGGVAYNPDKKLYYAVQAGSPGYILYTYDETGTQLAANTAGFDFRGLWWNPNSSSLEGNSYNGNGYRRVDLDADGYALSTGTNNPASNFQPNSQSQADYDYELDEVIYYYNNSIYRTSRATGALIGSAIGITGLPANTLNSTFVGYTGIPGEEVLIYDYSNKAVYFVDKTTGIYSRSVQLPSSAPGQSYLNTSYANGHIWISDGSVWRSFKISDSGLSDNCGTASATYDFPSGTCFPIGTTEVTLTATDAAGNEYKCSFNVTVVNQENAPNVVANPIEVYLDENGIYYLTPDDLKEMANGTTDDATPFNNLKLTAYPHIFRCNQIGEIIHTRLSVEDAEGNVSRAWTEVTVLDTIPPKAVCRNIEVYLDENGQAEITPEKVMDPASADACGIDTIAVDKNTFSCIDLGENTITLMVTDLSGNMSTCNAMVTVHDTLPPVPVEVADVLVEVEPGVCETLIEYPVDVVNDNCGVVLQQTAGLGPNGLFPIGTTVETWIATDNDGNMAEISFNVIVTTGNALPTLNAIGNVSANEDAPPLTVQLAGITNGVDCIEQEVSVTAQADNSELVASVAVEYTGEETGSLTITLAPDMAGTSVISVKVEDSEGGSVIQSFTLTVNPVNDSPFVVYPIADQVVNASYIIKLPVSSDLGFLFNDPDGDELTVSAMLENGNPIPSWAQIVGDTLVFNPMIADTGCYQIVVKATDPSGAFANNTFKLCVDGYPVSAPLVDGYSFDVKMYPNPTKDMVYLDVNNLEGISDLAVYSITGQEVLRRNFYQNKNISFSMSDFVSGIYLVKINSEGKQIIKKLVVDKH